MGGYDPFYPAGDPNERLPMGKKKSKRQIKGFPGYDLHLTVIIIIGLITLGFIKGCNG